MSKNQILGSPSPDDAVIPEGLVDIHAMARAVWPDDASRPSLRTLRKWTVERVIPSVRMGVLRFYEPARVKAVIRSKYEVTAA